MFFVFYIIYRVWVGFVVGLSNPPLLKMKLYLYQWMVLLEEWGLEGGLGFRVFIYNIYDIHDIYDIYA